METPLKIFTYRIPDACAVLGIGRTKLYALIAEGKIKASACGGRTLIPADALRDFVKNLPPAPIRAVPAKKAERSR